MVTRLELSQHQGRVISMETDFRAVLLLDKIVRIFDAHHVADYRPIVSQIVRGLGCGHDPAIPRETQQPRQRQHNQSPEYGLFEPHRSTLLLVWLSTTAR